MIFISPVPGQEGQNARFYADKGAAVVTKGTRDIVGTVKGLLADPEALDRMKKAAGGLFSPGAATVADYLLEK
jgi:processive 1,2-diacylglycerol beta-glucosyltransferase